jgi:hypothetical protein
VIKVKRQEVDFVMNRDEKLSSDYIYSSEQYMRIISSYFARNRFLLYNNDKPPNVA